MSVRIITDSAADFEPDELARRGVDCIPLSVSFDDVQYQDGAGLTKRQFYSLLESTRAFPHTSQPAPGDFDRVMGKAQKLGEQAVVITMSSALSSTYNGAVLAKERLGFTDCCIVDSLNATGGQRILVEQAVKLRDAGKSAGEIAAHLEKLRSRIVVYAYLDTLEYLYKGGRISRSAYTVGTAVHVKPIIHVSEDGRVVVSAKTIGLKRAANYLFKKVDEQPPAKDFPFYIMYTRDRENGLDMMKALRHKGIKVGENSLIELGPTIGSHVGPGGCGVIYVAEVGR